MWRTGKSWLPPTAGTVGKSQAGTAYCMRVTPRHLAGHWTTNEAAGQSFGVGLTRGRRVGECGQCVARRFDAYQRGVRRQVDVEAAGVRELRDDADVGERRRIAVTEATGRAIARKHLLQRVEADVDPVTIPVVLLFPRCADRADQVIQNAQVVERMN